jgi:hypothetical protein
MKEVKRIVNLIEQKRKTIERLQADLDSTRVTADGAAQFLPKLEELRLERRDIMAKALIGRRRRTRKRSMQSCRRSRLKQGPHKSPRRLRATRSASLRTASTLSRQSSMR